MQNGIYEQHRSHPLYYTIGAIGFAITRLRFVRFQSVRNVVVPRQPVEAMLNPISLEHFEWRSVSHEISSQRPSFRFSLASIAPHASIFFGRLAFAFTIPTQHSGARFGATVGVERISSPLRGIPARDANFSSRFDYGVAGFYYSGRKRESAYYKLFIDGDFLRPPDFFKTLHVGR